VRFRGVLFDSGDTLIRPVGGRWNPRFDFEEIVLRHLPELAVDSFPQAFAVGQKMLDVGPATPSLAAYHRAILHALGVGRPPPELLWELEQPGARPPVEPFPEVPGVLERLRAGGIRMAIVSDAWPGLDPRPSEQMSLIRREGHAARLARTSVWPRPPSHHEPITMSEPYSTGAADYRELAHELMKGGR
jgi:FMN phosphatase YigB (HAD superfamily)